MVSVDRSESNTLSQKFRTVSEGGECQGSLRWHIIVVPSVSLLVRTDAGSVRRLDKCSLDSNAKR